MKKAFIPLLLAQLLLAPVLIFAGISAEEYAFVQKCHDNVNVEKKQLSAVTAQECVKKLTDNAFLTKLRDQSPEMGEAALDILSYSNALIDLKNIITKNSGTDMVPHLARVLEKFDCPLCSMGLGPTPEKTFDWVGKEAGARLPDVKKAVRTWESLGAVRTKSLSSADYNYNQEKWNSQQIISRYQSISDWARKETDRLVDVYNNRSFWSKLTNKKPDPQLLSALREDFSAVGAWGQVARLDKLSADIGKMTDGKETAAPSAADKKAKELAAASQSVDGLKGKSESDQAAYLSGTFDQASIHAGDVPKPGAAAAKPGTFVFKELSEDQRAKLSGRMVTADARGNLKGPFADEMRGTKAGDEILAFYKDPKYAKADTNRLNFVFTEQPKGQFGGWSPSAKTMALNSDLVNEWMKKNQVTPEQLFEGDSSKNTHLQKLSQYLAPSFVHEATHQRQGAKAAAGGYDGRIFSNGRSTPYQMEMETEAFAMDNSFMAEHLQKRGASYADNLDPFDKRNTELFLEKGVEGVRLSNHRAYVHLESLEGSAAKEFAAASAAAKELRALEARYKAAPRAMTEDDLAEMRELRADMDSRFKWYTSVYADSVAAEAKINGWRNETKSKLYPSKSVGAEAPPELL